MLIYRIQWRPRPYCQRSGLQEPDCPEPECLRTRRALPASRPSECTPYTAERESTAAWGPEQNVRRYLPGCFSFLSIPTVMCEILCVPLTCTLKFWSNWRCPGVVSPGGVSSRRSWHTCSGPRGCKNSNLLVYSCDLWRQSPSSRLTCHSGGHSWLCSERLRWCCCSLWRSCWWSRLAQQNSEPNCGSLCEPAPPPPPPPWSPAAAGHWSSSTGKRLSQASRAGPDRLRHRRSRERIRWCWRLGKAKSSTGEQNSRVIDVF